MAMLSRSHTGRRISRLIVGGFTSWQHPRSYQDRYWLVTVCTHGDFIEVLHNETWPPGLGPDMPLSHYHHIISYPIVSCHIVMHQSCCQLSRCQRPVVHCHAVNHHVVSCHIVIHQSRCQLSCCPLSSDPASMLLAIMWSAVTLSASCCPLPCCQPSRCQLSYC